MSFVYPEKLYNMPSIPAFMLYAPKQITNKHFFLLLTAEYTCESVPYILKAVLLFGKGISLIFGG